MEWGEPGVDAAGLEAGHRVDDATADPAKRLLHVEAERRTVVDS